MDKILIPARRGSKGWAEKNRKLIRSTLESLDEDSLARTTVLTNDAVIEHQAILYGATRASRPNDSERDTSSVLEAIKPHCQGMDENTVITMLYLTYPHRTMENIKAVWDYWGERDLQSLLCRKPAKTNPYMCIFNINEEDKGEQVVEHDLYRRQDYPDAWEISHFVSMFKVSEIENLNCNFYNPKTAFFLLDDKCNSTDIDEESDLT